MTARRGPSERRRYPSECFPSGVDEVAMTAAPQTPDAFTDLINVLVLIGIPGGSGQPGAEPMCDRQLAGRSDGERVQRPWVPAPLPRSVGNTGEAGRRRRLAFGRCRGRRDIVVTSYRGRVPSMAHNAIDWLTRRWRHGALHDKPLAVIGRSAGCYSGVWSRQVEDTRGRLGSRVIEPLTVPTLREAAREACR